MISTRQIKNYSPSRSVTAITKPNHGFSVGDIVAPDNTPYTGGDTIAGIVGNVDTPDRFTMHTGGILNSTVYTNGTKYYVDPATNTIKPESAITWSAGEIRRYIGIGVEGGLLIELDNPEYLDISLSFTYFGVIVSSTNYHKSNMGVNFVYHGQKMPIEYIYAMQGLPDTGANQGTVDVCINGTKITTSPLTLNNVADTEVGTNITPAILVEGDVITFEVTAGSNGDGANLNITLL